MQSEQINELIDALAKVQAKIKAAPKSRDNGAFKGAKYADLPTVWEVCREELSSNGIAVVQAPQFHLGGDMYLETTLAHKSGQWMKSHYPIKPTKTDPQGVASAITYARRYALSAMVGVVADDDDDGNAASAGTVQQSSAGITPKQLAELRAMIADTGTDIEKFCQYLGIQALPDLDAKGFERAVAALKKKTRKAQPLAEAAE